MAMQVVDDVEGPMTKREFELFQVPVGETLLGQVCNFVGQSKSPQVKPLPSNSLACMGLPPCCCFALLLMGMRCRAGIFFVLLS